MWQATAQQPSDSFGAAVGQVVWRCVCTSAPTIATTRNRLSRGASSRTHGEEHSYAHKPSALVSGSVLVLLTALLFGSLMPAQVAPAAAPTGQRLRDLAGSSFLIGYAAMSTFRSISDIAQFQEVARSEFNFVTSENALKWDATEPSQNSFTFTQSDTTFREQ